MAKAAKPYKEGKTWSMRRRVLGQELYVSGRDTKTEAAEAMKALVEPLMQRGRPKGWGPLETTVAQALQDYGMERLRFLKGAVQDANRLNRWLRAADLATLEVTPNDPTQVPQADEADADAATAGQRFLVALKEPEGERSIPRGLADHRLKLATKSAKSDSVRTRLARMSMAEVKRYHVQELVDALAAEGKLSATLRQEQATLRNLFNHARVSWCWAHPVENPATTLKIKWKDNARSRVMSKAEQARLDEAIADCRNHLVGPTISGTHFMADEYARQAGVPIAFADDLASRMLQLARRLGLPDEDDQEGLLTWQSTLLNKLVPPFSVTAKKAVERDSIGYYTRAFVRVHLNGGQPASQDPLEVALAKAFAREGSSSISSARGSPASSHPVRAPRDGEKP